MTLPYRGAKHIPLWSEKSINFPICNYSRNRDCRKKKKGYKPSVCIPWGIFLS